jgi:dTDP-glucose 4,6-dehydratase
VLKTVGVDDSLVNYEEAEAFTTKVKTIDCSKAIRDLKHDPKVSPEVGISRTVDWMRKYYRVGE